MAETRALGLQAPDEAVETTHVIFAPKVCWHSLLFEAQASGRGRRNGWQQPMIALARPVNSLLSRRRADHGWWEVYMRWLRAALILVCVVAVPIGAERPSCIWR